MTSPNASISMRRSSPAARQAGSCVGYMGSALASSLCGKALLFTGMAYLSITATELEESAIKATVWIMATGSGGAGKAGAGQALVVPLLTPQKGNRDTTAQSR